MPEIVEAEIIKNYLRKEILNQEIKKVKILNRSSFKGNLKKIIGRKIVQIRRLGKMILFDLNDLFLLFHLKMTGQIIYLNKKFFNDKDIFEKFKHIRVIFYLEDKILLFNDIRKFGFIRVLNLADLLKEKQNLGVDPLTKNLNFKFLKTNLSKSKKTIKNFLLDQKKIAGLGNIYTNECLFLAKIHPQSLSFKIPDSKIRDLMFSIKKIIRKALKYEGSSINSYFKPDYTQGNYQNKFLVYKREGQFCLFCKNYKIKRSKIGQRSTFYCSNCQKNFNFKLRYA